jgi:hypothetical protein
MPAPFLFFARRRTVVGALSGFVLLALGACDPITVVAVTPSEGGGGSTGFVSSAFSSKAVSVSTGIGGGGGAHGLYGLTANGSEVTYVRVDPDDGAVTALATTSMLTPDDIQGVDAVVDPTTSTYVALLSNPANMPNVVTFDLATGALLSKVAAPKETGLLCENGGAIFCLSEGASVQGLGVLDPSTGAFTKIGEPPPANFLDASTSNGVDRYFMIAGSDGVFTQRLYTWDTTNGNLTQSDIPQDRKYIGAQFDRSLGELFVLTFDAGSNPLIHVVSMDTATGAMTLVMTLPVTPSSTSPQDDIEYDDTTYDSAGHRIFVVTHDATQPAVPDQLFVVDTPTGTIVASPIIDGPAGAIHGLRFVP